ncbi:MAG: AAA family ATPase [Candidatus Hermodarchaeota archaeon]
MNLKLDSIEIKNFLSYKHAKFSNIKNFNVLIGKNSSGKSNFIKILEMLKRRYNNEKFFVSYLFDEREDLDNEINLKFVISPKLREEILTFLYKGNYLKKSFIYYEHKDDYLKRNEWQNQEIAVNWLLTRGYFAKLIVKISYMKDIKDILIKQISVEHINTREPQTLFNMEPNKNNYKPQYLSLKSILNKAFTEFFSTNSLTDMDISGTFDFKSMLNLRNRDQIKNDIPILIPIFNDLIKNFFEAIHFIPYKREFKPEYDRSGIRINLAPNGENIVKFIHIKAATHEWDWLREWNNEMKDFVSNIVEIRQDVDEKSDNTYLILKEDGLNMDILQRNMGAGLLNIAHFLAFIKDLDRDKILCIEEPELFIYPGLQKKLKNKLLRTSNKIQIFITTHTPSLLSRNSKKCAIYKIIKNQTESVVRNISDTELIEVLSELELNIYDYLLCDSIVFVEGKEDFTFFNLILNSLFESTFKIIPCEGKKNFYYFATSRILHLLVENSLNYLFLLDYDRGNEQIWDNVQDIELKKELKSNTLKLSYYEIENIFTQPIIIIDYLFTLGKISNLMNDFDWIAYTLRELFNSYGNNFDKYVLKDFLDNNFAYFGENDIQNILDFTNKNSHFEDKFNIWISEISDISKQKDSFCLEKKLDKQKMFSTLNKIKDNYLEKFMQGRYNEIVSGKLVFKDLKNEITKKFRLKEAISSMKLSIHLVEFLQEYLLFELESKEKKIAVKTELQEIPAKSLKNFELFCKKIKDLIINIKESLELKFQEEFTQFQQLDFQFINQFLKNRYKL